jgi:hypothetical protein
MLEVNVLKCIDAINETGVGYTWTYLGKQCCYRLGVFDPPPTEPFSGSSPQHVVIDTSFYELLEKVKGGTIVAPAKTVEDQARTDDGLNG